MDKDILQLAREYLAADTLDDRVKSAGRLADFIIPPIKAHLLKRSPEHFEEVFALALEGVFSSLPKFKGETAKALWSFLYTIAENKIRDVLRRKARDHRFVSADADELMELVQEMEAKGGIAPGDMVDYQYLIGLIQKSKPGCVDFLYKRIALGWKFEDIAEYHGLRVPTARIRTSRCLKLAQELARKHP